MAISRRRKSKRHTHHKRHSTHRRKVKRYSRRGTKRRRRKRTKRVKRGGTRKNVMKGGAKYTITVTPRNKDSKMSKKSEMVYTGKPFAVRGRHIKASNPPTGYNILKKTIHQYSGSRNISIRDFIKDNMYVTVPEDYEFEVDVSEGDRKTKYTLNTGNVTRTDQPNQYANITIVRDNTIKEYREGAQMEPEKSDELAAEMRRKAAAASAGESEKSLLAWETYKANFDARRESEAEAAEKRGEVVPRAEAMPFEEWEHARDDEIADHEMRVEAQEKAPKLDNQAAADTRNLNIKMDKITNLINELIKKNSGDLNDVQSYPERLRAAENIVYNNEDVKRERSENQYNITDTDIDTVIESSLEKKDLGKEFDIQTLTERRKAEKEKEGAAAEEHRRSNDD